jgi:hypothetical protein
VATLLADSPPAPANGQAPQDGSNGTPAEPPAGPAQPAAVQSCAKCGAAMAAGQDWCLQCGAGAPGSIGTPGWRSTAAIVGAVAVLVLGAAAAAVAALSKGSAKARVVTTTVAQTAAPTATTPATPGTTPPTTTPGGVAKTPKPVLPLGAVKPPKIPLTAVTPKASEKTTTTPAAETNTTPTSTTPATSTTGEKTSEESQQAALVLDTNAAQTYNPYNYPASDFGGPSLAIDGDPATAWTAQVNPATAPKMAEGLLINLKAKQQLAVLQLITSTTGMTVQVYGANGHTVPSSITEPAWIPLSPPKVIKKKQTRFALRDSKKTFTFVTLWISQAPPSSTAEAPGHVSVDELELFPPS